MLNLEKTELDDVHIIRVKRNLDERGDFIKLFDRSVLNFYNKTFELGQLNISSTTKMGTVRGLHYQFGQYTEKKIVYCLNGKVFDVIVDLRKKSRTFLRKFTIELDSAQTFGLLIPEGCAHGYQTLVNDCQILYLHSNMYNRDFEYGINVNDPIINIPWPKKIINLSERDQNFRMLSKDFAGI